MQKKKVRSYLAVFQILNLIIASIAFTVILSSSSSSRRTKNPIPTDTRVVAKGAIDSARILPVGEVNYYVSGKLTPGEEITGKNIITGEKNTLQIGGNINDMSLEPATELQNQFISKTVTIDGTKYTLSHALETESLKAELLKNPDLLEGTGVKISEEAGKLTIREGSQIHTLDTATGELTTIGAPKPGSQLSEFLLPESAYGGFMDAALSGVMYAAIFYAIGQLGGSLLGMDKEQTKAISTALAGGAFTYNFLTKYRAIGLDTGFFAAGEKGFLGLGGLGWATVASAVIFVVMYKKTSTETVEFKCLPWQAPSSKNNGQDCEKCNEDINPCSEYRCKSLGQSCELLNAGTGQEKCVWKNPQDAKSPGIIPWEDVLTEGYKYTDVRIRPPGDGSEPGRMRIVNENSEDGCVKAFTPLEFGITTTGPDGESEPAQCKIDYNHTLKFDDMGFWFGESNLFLYNHSQKLSLPSPAAIAAEAPELQHDGTYTLYVRCKDANGNENKDEFAIRFCVEKGPDTTPPKIESTSIANGMPVKYNQSSVDLEVYVNEPADCRWSREDRDYDNMENEMNCLNKVWEMNNNLVYTCKTTLTGMQDRIENKFYFRCKDQPTAAEEDRNKNMQGYLFTLFGTEPLNIIDVKPNGTIKGNTDVVSIWLEVETANGYNNGDAICYYGETGKENDYIEFRETGTAFHKQRLDLVAESYVYYIKCVDLGGNRDDNKTEFTVEVDRTAPLIARAYKENELLKIITTEDSTCRYDIKSCNFLFDDGVDMPYANQTEHFAEWKTENTYFIRCSDVYGNQPLPNSCTMIVRPYDVVEQKVEE